MRVRSARTAVLSLIAPMFGALALVGCSQRTEVTETYAPPPPPPPARVEPVLMGAPQPTAQSQAEARAAERQAHDDTWLANLPEGVIAHREVDPRTGRVVWIISNRPIPNPTGPSHGWRAHHSYPHLNGGERHHHAGPAVVAMTPAAPAPQAKVAPAAPAPVAKPAPAPKAAIAPTPAAQPTTATPPDAAVAPKPPFTMSPMLWLVAGIVLLILVLLILLGGRKSKRRTGAAHAH